MECKLTLVNATALNYFGHMANAMHPVTASSKPASTLIDAIDDLACTHSALRRAARQLGNLYDEAVAPTHLKATQIALLGQIEGLGDKDGPALQLLAEQLAIRISAVTHALRPLVRDGLVELRADDHDKRTKRATLTTAGRERMQKGLRLWAAANRRTEKVLGTGPAHALRKLADQVSSKDFLAAYTKDRALETITEMP